MWSNVLVRLPVESLSDYVTFRGHMAAQLFFVLFIVIALVVVAAKSVAITKEGERLVVFRLGQLLQVYPPGLTLLIPFIDRGVKVRVDQIAKWETLPESELAQKLAQVVIEKSA